MEVVCFLHDDKEKGKIRVRLGRKVGVNMAGKVTKVNTGTAGTTVTSRITRTSIAEILKFYKPQDKFLGYKAAAAFEADVVRVAENGGITFAEFKKIISFLESNTFDDSATGLEYLYAALNKVLKTVLGTTSEGEKGAKDSTGAKEKAWKWVKEHLLCYNDFFLETVISLYKETHREELLAILKQAVDEDDCADAPDDAPDDYDDFDDDEAEFYKHSGEYYVALCLKGTPEYEAYLDKCLKDNYVSSFDTSDIKLLKSDLLVSRGDKKAAFEVIKAEPEYVLKAAELLDGDAKEEYLFSQVMGARETVVGQRRSWWDKLCESIKNTAYSGMAGINDGDEHSDDAAGEVSNSKLDHYMRLLMSSPKHCEMVNWQLYELGRYEELKARIDTGWIYDDLWGKLNTDCVSKFEAIKGYKKLKTLYPEWCAQIMIDYAVFMMDRKNRQSYIMSTQTMVRAGKLSDKSMEMAKKAAKDLVEKNPRRTAMIEELEKAGLV